MATLERRTFAPRPDGTTRTLVVLELVFTGMCIGYVFLRFAKGGPSAVLGVTPAVVFLFGLLAAMLVVRAYRNSIRITCTPTAIEWRRWRTHCRLRVDHIKRCTIRRESSENEMIQFKLIFELDDGTQQSTPSLSTAQFPHLIGALEKRYPFPICVPSEANKRAQRRTAGP